MGVCEPGVARHRVEDVDGGADLDRRPPGIAPAARALTPGQQQRGAGRRTVGAGGLKDGDHPVEQRVGVTLGPQHRLRQPEVADREPEHDGVRVRDLAQGKAQRGHRLRRPALEVQRLPDARHRDAVPAGVRRRRRPRAALPPRPDPRRSRRPCSRGRRRGSRAAVPPRRASRGLRSGRRRATPWRRRCRSTGSRRAPGRRRARGPDEPLARTARRATVAPGRCARWPTSSVSGPRRGGRPRARHGRRWRGPSPSRGLPRPRATLLRGRGAPGRAARSSGRAPPGAPR